MAIKAVQVIANAANKPVKETAARVTHDEKKRLCKELKARSPLFKDGDDSFNATLKVKCSGKAAVAELKKLGWTETQRGGASGQTFISRPGGKWPLRVEDLGTSGAYIAVNDDDGSGSNPDADLGLELYGKREHYFFGKYTQAQNDALVKKLKSKGFKKSGRSGTTDSYVNGSQTVSVNFNEREDSVNISIETDTKRGS